MLIPDHDQYLCDGAADCSDGYDEDARLCTAARRPPVEETSSFLKSLLASHGPNYLEKLFGPKARNNMQALGGVDDVAIALSGIIGYQYSYKWYNNIR